MLYLKKGVQDAVHVEILNAGNMKSYKIETIRWIEGYEHETFIVKAETEEIAKALVLSGEADSNDGWVDTKNGEALEIINIEEN